MGPAIAATPAEAAGAGVTTPAVRNQNGMRRRMWDLSMETLPEHNRRTRDTSVPDCRRNHYAWWIRRRSVRYFSTSRVGPTIALIPDGGIEP